jgi:hypothetical protein
MDQASNEAAQVLQLLEKFAGRTRDVDAPGDAPLAVFHALYNACLFAALRAVSGFGSVHDLFAIGRFCNLWHFKFS